MKGKSLRKIVIIVGIILLMFIGAGLVLLNQIANNFYQPPSTLEINWYDASKFVEGSKETYITTKEGTFMGESDKFMRREVLNQWEEINKLNQDKDMFSRCGSGAHSYLTEEINKDDAFYYGYIRTYKGCMEAKEISFRISKKNPAIDILDPETKKYVPVKDWLKTAKPVDWNIQKNQEIQE